ncbi:MAG: hypothetical protein KatS3mg082_1164 [Nitrospiraceae bacterium]|nr:MAG: hypothetical protein KatS3mg082_1164 [Nitrospiraceae bacterium]
MQSFTHRTGAPKQSLIIQSVSYFFCGSSIFSPFRNTA